MQKYKDIWKSPRDHHSPIVIKNSEGSGGGQSSSQGRTAKASPLNPKLSFRLLWEVEPPTTP